MFSPLALSSMLWLALLSPVNTTHAAPIEGDALVEQLAGARRASRAPAMAAGAIDADGGRCTAIAGERAAGTGVPAEPDDRWHIGSISKSFTALVAAHAVDRGMIRWDTTIIEALPAFEGRISRLYHSVTLEQLLSARAGIVPFDAGVHRWMGQLRAPQSEQRLAACERILNLRPVAPPGAQHIYSNFGFIVAAAMLDEAAGSPWEELVHRWIAAPLGMDSLGFGPPGDPHLDAPDQPWGHLVGPERAVPVPPGRGADNPPVYGPAGTIHASIEDLLDYADAYRRTLITLHDPRTPDEAITSLGITAGAARRLLAPRDDERTSYALGLLIGTDERSRPTMLWHNGSNTMWYAEMLIVIGPDGRARAAVVCANGSDEGIERSVAGLVRALVREPAE